MWSDTLLAAERLHLLRFAIWGTLSALLGLGMLVVPLVRRRRTPLVEQFALQTAIWGGIALLIAILGWWRAELRDFAGAARLEQFVQVMIAIGVGFIGGGITLAIRGWRGDRLGLAGAGIGLVVQGTGWLILHIAFALFLRTGP